MDISISSVDCMRFDSLILLTHFFFIIFIDVAKVQTTEPGCVGYPDMCQRLFTFRVTETCIQDHRTCIRPIFSIPRPTVVLSPLSPQTMSQLHDQNQLREASWYPRKSLRASAGPAVAAECISRATPATVRSGRWQAARQGRLTCVRGAIGVTLRCGVKR